MSLWDQTLVLYLLLLFFEAVCAYYSIFSCNVLGPLLNQKKLKREGVKTTGSKTASILKTQKNRFCVGSVYSLATYSAVVCIFLGKLSFGRILEDMPAKRAVLLLPDG